MVTVKKKGYWRTRRNRKEYVKPHSQSYYEGKSYPKRGRFMTSRHRGGVNKTFWTMNKSGHFTGRIPLDTDVTVGDRTGIKNTDKRRIIGRLESPYQNKTKKLWEQHYSKYGKYPPKQNYKI